MTTEQKIWKAAGCIFSAIRPFFLYVAAPGICMSIGYILRSPDMSAREFFIYGSNFYTALGMFLALYLLYRLSKKRGQNFFEETTLFFDRLTVKKAAGFFLFGFLTAWALSAFLTLVPIPFLGEQYSESSGRMYAGRDLLFVFVTTVITAPLLEEIVFRGYMLNRLLVFFSEKTAVYIVSALFALCHGNLIWIIYAFLMGLLMSRIAMKEDNIAGTVCMHMGFNFPSVMIVLINQNPELEQRIFGSDILIFLYGLLAAAGILAMVQFHRREEELS